MKRYIHSTEDIFAMSNVRGRHIKVEEGIPFSFYYSPKNSSHGPRVKPLFNPSTINMDDAGTLKLCDDWEFIPGINDKHHSSADVNNMKAFFRKYLVLFLIVWDKLIDDPELEDYLRGDSTLHEFICNLRFYSDYKDELDKIHSVSELEEFCRQNDLVNFYGN